METSALFVRKISAKYFSMKTFIKQTFFYEPKTAYYTMCRTLKLCEKPSLLSYSVWAV